MRGIGLLLLLGLGAGCASTANSVSPARDGFVYVAGSESGHPKVWLCPAVAGRGGCTDVEVTEEMK